MHPLKQSEDERLMPPHVNFASSCDTVDSMSSVCLLKNGEAAFPAMFAAIDQAALSIELEMYVFTDDETGREFRRHLTSAAKRGVSVRVLVDSWGSWNLPDSFWDELRAMGGIVRWFHPISKGLLPFRNHRKLLLIDDSIAFTGGLNIADEYYGGAHGQPPWRDNVLKISGPEVALLKNSFFRMWRIAEYPIRRLIERLRSIRRRGKRKSSILFLESGPDNPARPVRRAYRKVIVNAVNSIDLAMGYFYPHGRMLRAFKRATKRGVRVRLMVPLHTDVPIARWAARGLYGRLLRAGVEIWEYLPSMMHSKLAIADDTVIAGSANLDIRSGRFNYELVAIVNDSMLAAQARADFQADIAQSVRVTYDEWQKRPFFQKVKERLSYCLLARVDIILSSASLRKRLRTRPRS
jgi:cardiolipin synthase